MIRDQLRDEVFESHRQLMDYVEKESPSVTLRAKIVRVDGKTVEFVILSSSARLRTSKMVEEKVFAKTARGEVEGTVLAAYEKTITVQFKRRIGEKSGVELPLACNSNHNNEILLEAAESFFESEKLVHPMIFECYKRSSRGLRFKSDKNKPDEGKSDKSTYENEKSDEIQKSDETPFFNPKLNESQRSAVLKSLSLTPFKILGPPGTGKTETVVEIISQHLKNNRTVLICGPSNISVDNIISRFILSPYNAERPTSFYRLGSSVKGLVHFNLEHMANEAVSFMEADKNEEAFGKAVHEKRQEFIRSYRKECPLVFATLFSSMKESFFFDLCIVDEACQAAELECLMGIVKARSFILVGDPNQLCPVFESLYEHLELPVVRLVEQYRMHGELLAFSNEEFYGNEIVSPKEDEFRFFGQSRILVVDTSYFECREAESGQSKMNRGEAEIVRRVIEWLQREGRREIGVIAPYSGQVRELKEMVDVEVETVDGFQGQERDFIVLSLVRSNDDGEIGFLSDRRRLNVALTRCKRGLVIVGDGQSLSRDKFFRGFFRFLEDRAYVVDPEMFESIAGPFE